MPSLAFRHLRFYRRYLFYRNYRQISRIVFRREKISPDSGGSHSIISRLQACSLPIHTSQKDKGQPSKALPKTVLRYSRI